MKNIQFNRFLATMLTLVMTSVLFTPVLAAAKYDTTDKKPVSKSSNSGARAALLQSIKAQDGQTEFSAEELEQMRAALLELVNSNQELSSLLSPKGKERVREFGPQKDEDQFAEARKQIEEMSSQELTTIRKALNPSKIRSKLMTARATLVEYKNSAMKVSADMSNAPGLPGIDSYCGAPVSTEAIIAADVIYFAAEAVRDIAQDGCNQVAVVAGFGANTRAACLVTDAIYITAKAVNQGIHFCDDDYAASVGQASFDRLGHVHDDLTTIKANDDTNYTNIIGNAATNTTTITTAVTNAKTEIVNNDNTNKNTITTAISTSQTAVIKAGDANSAAIINNDNANKTTIVNNDNTNTAALTALINNALATIITNANANKNELKSLILRTQIEADLSSTDGSTFVALYETGSTTCTASFATPVTQCGYLDLVRIIVSETIANVAGSSAASAQKDLAAGDAQRAAGQFKAAYTSYRKAYKTAAK